MGAAFDGGSLAKRDDRKGPGFVADFADRADVVALVERGRLWGEAAILTAVSRSETTEDSCVLAVFTVQAIGRSVRAQTAACSLYP